MTTPPTPDPAALAREAIADDAKATPGPWSQGVSGVVADYGATGYWMICEEPSGDLDEIRADMTFIANARTREPILAREVLRLRGLIEWYTRKYNGIDTLPSCETCQHLGCMMARGESAPGEGK